jgi:hypothetical protein
MRVKVLYALPRESISEYCDRLVKQAIHQNSTVYGVFNTISFIACPDTAPEYLEGYYSGRIYSPMNER